MVVVAHPWPNYGPAVARPNSHFAFLTLALVGPLSWAATSTAGFALRPRGRAPLVGFCVKRYTEITLKREPDDI